MNNYDNAEPKPLKFLVSDGKLVDESGNVIAESDSLQGLYIKSSPQVKKYLLSDGSVVDENNNLIIKNDYFKKVYDQASPKVAKYLHSDGTIDENSGSGGATAYAWVNTDDAEDVWYTNFDIAPETLTNEKSITIDGGVITVDDFKPSYEKISDTSFLVEARPNITYTRDATKDFTLWQSL